MTQGVIARVIRFAAGRGLKVLAVGALVASSAAAAAPSRLAAGLGPREGLRTVIERAITRVAPPQESLRLVWDGRDVDGDGKADFANPTGKAVRDFDAYGSGAYGASRDGGVRRHEGVDYVARAGQTVVAPISGFISRIGFAYAGDEELRYVEILNPALGYAARVFYIDPAVEIGEAVAVGQPIGEAHSLQRKYPAGMTDHVHLEVLRAGGRRIDASEIITAEYVRVRRSATQAAD